MATTTVNTPWPSIEEQLHHATQIKRIRVSEFFKDYDPLRSGYITSKQFRRCLDQHLSLKLSDSEWDKLCEKHSDGKNEQINYQAFAEQLENAFNPAILDGRPEEQIAAFRRAVHRTSCELPSHSKEVTDRILQRCQEYNQYHGISVKSCYIDFDRHHRGFITKSQFYRNFPGPSDVTPAEVTALAQRYFDPSNGLYNYFDFHYDMERLRGSGSEQLNMSPEILRINKGVNKFSLEDVFQKVKDAVYKNGVRTTEFFKDHDKLRSGVITENQFVRGLSMCCGRAADLSWAEIQCLVDYYRTDDKRVHYKEFCNLMENAYNVADLEAQPTTDIDRPLRGHLIRPLNSLASAANEEKVASLLDRLRIEVRKRHLMLYPYFKDFDRGKGYTRGVTKAHFQRVLDFCSLGVTQDEIKLLMSKFEAGNGTDINYVAFVQSIDTEYTGQVKQEPVVKLSQLINQNVASKEQAVDLQKLIARIREHVVINRIRVSEHFEDFDPLRSGSISRDRFRQGLSSMGRPYLTDEQLKVLSNHFRHSKHPERVDWKKFSAQVDPVLTVEGPLLRDGAVDFSNAPQDDYQLLEEVMHRLREKVSQRRVLTKPCFQDFDRHHMGYVTPSQFQQCLSYLGLSSETQELAVMEQRFSDDKGFNYLAFLEKLDPMESLENKYCTRMTLLKETEPRESKRESVSADEILTKVKNQVSKNRVRVLEFIKDYDKLRNGRILKTSFRRALDLCGFGLSDTELTALEKRYQSVKDPLYVNYMGFSDEIESLFTTKNLEKMPTAEVKQFRVPKEVDLNVLSPEEEQILQDTLHRLAERVRVRRIQLIPLFEDYDKVHIGSVTHSQFHRVLSELELGGLVNALEFQILFKKFGVKIGPKKGGALVKRRKNFN